jgi:hypothetical protein
VRRPGTFSRSRGGYTLECPVEETLAVERETTIECPTQG